MIPWYKPKDKKLAKTTGFKVHRAVSEMLVLAMRFAAKEFGIPFADDDDLKQHMLINMIWHDRAEDYDDDDGAWVWWIEFAVDQYWSKGPVDDETKDEPIELNYVAVEATRKKNGDWKFTIEDEGRD